MVPVYPLSFTGILGIHSLFQSRPGVVYHGLILPSFIQITAKHPSRTTTARSHCIKNQSERWPDFSSSNPRDIAVYR